MSEMRAALVKATRGLDALLKPLEALQPLRDALGEALDVEKYLDDQRAAKAAMSGEIEAIRTSLVGAKGAADAARREAGAIVADAKASAATIAADAKADADRILGVVRDKSLAAMKALDDAHAKAAGIVAAAVSEADGKRAEIAALTKELADLDAKVKQARQAATRIREALS
jgi:cell division septum initiation protein DivIVA